MNIIYENNLLSLIIKKVETKSAKIKKVKLAAFSDKKGNNTR